LTNTHHDFESCMQAFVHFPSMHDRKSRRSSRGCWKLFGR